MDVNKAKALKVNHSYVTFPTDGRPAWRRGKVIGVGVDVHRNIYGTEYVWVDLGRDGVWPSNRIH